MTAGQVWRMPLGTSGLGAPAADSGVAPELAHRAASAMATAKRVAIDDLARFMLLPSIAGAGSTGRYRSQCQCRVTDQMSEAARSQRSAAKGAARSPYRAVWASDATPRCASMASADRQMIGDATLDLLHRHE